MKILLKRVDNLGDVVIIIPIITALKETFPRAQITAMVKPQHRDVLNGHVNDFKRPKKCLNKITGFDKIIDIDYSLPPGYIPKDIKSSKRISLGIKSFRRKRHVSRQLFDHLKLHGIKAKFTAPVIYVDQIQKKKVRKWLLQQTINQNDFVVTIDPGSNFYKKCWPVRNYITLCKWLIDSFNAKIILLGAKEDRNIKWIKENINSQNLISLTGKPLKFVTALISSVDLHISNDSGLGHVAAAVKTPAITVFGPTSPVLWKPYSSKSIPVFNPGVDCKGGYEHAATCAIQKCLISIKPKDIADAVLASINRYIRPKAPHKFDKIFLSPHLKIRRNKKNILIKNQLTGHSCLIENGWSNINQVLHYISISKSFKKTQLKFKESNALLDFFFVHRFIVPPNVAESGIYL